MALLKPNAQAVDTTAQAPAAAPVAPAVQTTPVAPATPETVLEAKTNTLKEERIAAAKKFKSDGQELRKIEDADANTAAVRGSMQDAVKFLRALGNPSAKATATIDGKTEVPSMEIVGYEFEALKPVKVPVVDRTGLTKKNVMGFNSVTYVDVQAGQTFSLSRAELALMIAQVEYDGMFTGGGEPVTVSVIVSKSQGVNYAPVAYLTKVKVDENTKSIKECIIPIATQKAGTEGKSIKDWDVKPEYAQKFGYLFEPVAGTGRGQTSRKKELGETAATVAASLRAYYNKMNSAQ